MKYWKIIVVISFLFVLFSSNWCGATVWYLYDNEDGLEGNNLPSSINGPYYFEYNQPGKYESDSVRGKFAVLETVNLQDSYFIQIWNPNGTYGAPFSDRNPIRLVAGTRYYLGGFFRFDRINGFNIWTNYNDFDKLLEITGTGFRWMIVSGWSAGLNGVDNKYSFTVHVAKSRVPSWPGFDQLEHNYGGYTQQRPYLCDYEKWYAVVMEVTAQANSSGMVRLWINGSQVLQHTGNTMENEATFSRLQLNGTIGQPAYDAPAHRRKFDRIILTDNWQDIINGGYMSANPAPAAPTGLRIIPSSN